MSLLAASANVEPTDAGLAGGSLRGRDRLRLSLDDDLLVPDDEGDLDASF